VDWLGRARPGGEFVQFQEPDAPVIDQAPALLIAHAELFLSDGDIAEAVRAITQASEA
jgi:hypothetical protein